MIRPMAAKAVTERIWRFVERLLDDDRALLVMTGLPDADDRAVSLNLVDVATFDPDVLDSLHRLGDNGLSHYRSGYDRRSHHGRRRHHHRFGDRSPDDAADHSADEARPEVATTAPPEAAMMMVHWTGMMHRRTRSTAMKTTGAVSAWTMRTSEYRSGYHTRAKRDYHFHLVHVSVPFSA